MYAFADGGLAAAQDRAASPPDADLAPAERAMIEALYRRHAAALRRFIRARIRSEIEAEDVLHDVFLRICRRGDPGSLQSPAAVLFKTAFRLTLNAIRRRRNSPIDQSCEIDGLELADGAKTPEEELIVRREFDRFLGDLAGLPTQCRKVLTLRAVEGLSYDEMSRRLGLSVSTLEKHVVRGRRILRQERDSDRRAAVSPFIARLSPAAAPGLAPSPAR